MTTATATATATAVRTFAIDKTHSEATFQVRHLITKVRGRFADFEGTISFNETQPAQSSVSFTIQAASIDTSTPDRDAHLRSDDFFAVETYPTITFESTAITALGGNDYQVAGNLTMRGVTKAITIPVTLVGTAVDPWGNQKLAFEGEGLRSELERGTRGRRLPGGRRREDQPVDSGRSSEVGVRGTVPIPGRPRIGTVPRT
jgi:polyisoprenoid-binding protein YceI